MVLFNNIEDERLKNINKFLLIYEEAISIRDLRTAYPALENLYRLVKPLFNENIRKLIDLEFISIKNLKKEVETKKEKLEELNAHLEDIYDMIIAQLHSFKLVFTEGRNDEDFPMDY